MSVIDFSPVIDTVRDLGLFKSVCEIRALPGAVSTGGAPDLDPAHATTRTGMGAIPCMLASSSFAFSPRMEINRREGTEQLADFQALLDGYFPQITQSDLAVIDGDVYNIVSVDTSSQGADVPGTLLSLRVVIV